MLYDQSEIIKVLMSAEGLYKKSKFQEISVAACPVPTIITGQKEEAKRAEKSAREVPGGPSMMLGTLTLASNASHRKYAAT